MKRAIVGALAVGIFSFLIGPAFADHSKRFKGHGRNDHQMGLKFKLANAPLHGHQADAVQNVKVTDLKFECRDYGTGANPEDVRHDFADFEDIEPMFTETRHRDAVEFEGSNGAASGLVLTKFEGKIYPEEDEDTGDIRLQAKGSLRVKRIEPDLNAQAAGVPRVCDSHNVDWKARG